ncbi:hypothetical protein [Vibrio aestuarianus]|uniref:Uncharacterized protein n=1 Tax=Vibrio aestuarianus TaxID=28171 RepID=A0ABM9FS63_9VIBR|nr:hypothetical protein [Vibrio aestuarianus]CAH8201804.1 conserved hypothetical protein [Vibrio aestuarianus]CAH8205699.1 conserved hypothetical protein [Vibrio aestuarianus subsp. francensis]CAH8206463.1 conserved hypothetical protein [Vibrio aestuarianus]CAH8206491.1 conserved hypothetical protein [Vibrio aestuarianus]CAH8206628.1 conserved hypothetical protein [Vibrio aestuarianus]
MLKRRMQSKHLSKTVSANRRKRMLANNKKKIIWRNRAFMQLLAS